MAVAALFDHDGTHEPFELDIRIWRRAHLVLMAASGFATAGLDPGVPTQEILDSARDQAAADGPERFIDLRRKAFSILDELELKGVESASLFPGTVEALSGLKARGIRLCVLTNSGRAAASRTLARWDLAKYFEFVLTRDDTDEMKPRPQGLLKALAMLGVGPGEAFYIGDSRYDIMAARGAGVSAVGVATGNYSADRLRSDGADYVGGSLAEVSSLLGVEPNKGGKGGLAH